MPFLPKGLQHGVHRDRIGRQTVVGLDQPHRVFERSQERRCKGRRTVCHCSKVPATRLEARRRCRLGEVGRKQCEFRQRIQVSRESVPARFRCTRLLVKRSRCDCLNRTCHEAIQNGNRFIRSIQTSLATMQARAFEASRALPGRSPLNGGVTGSGCPVPPSVAICSSRRNT